jgi:hypothetical protein
MKALWCLLRIYFGAIPWMRWCAGAGFLMILSGSLGVYLMPLSLFWVETVIGICALFLGTGLMPVVVGRLISGHALYVLPFGRLKMLISIVAALALLALIFAGLVSALYAQYSLAHGMVFAKALIVSFLTFAMMYVLLWFFSRAQSALGLLVGAMLVIASLGLPFRFIYWAMMTSILWPLIGGGLIFGACIAAFLLGPRVKHALVQGLASSRFVSAGENRRNEYTRGKEVDLLIGTTRPWVLALGQVVPIIVAGLFVDAPGFWLFYFALFSVISGATTSFAASRSRALWLRAGWSREELFARIEMSFWRHHGYSLTALLLLFIGMGTYLKLPDSLLWLGLPLLAAGTAVSTYLGLMMTRGIGWLDSALAISTMVLLMAAAVVAASGTPNVPLVVGMEASLAALAWLFRAAAKRRWTQLDWLLCRPLAGDAARTSF